MKLSIKSIFVIILMALVTIGGTTSCGSKKKMAKKEYEERLAQTKNDLNAIIEGSAQWTLEEQIARLDEIDKMDLQSEEIDGLMVKAREVVEDRRVEAESEKQRLAEEERLRRLEEQNKVKSEPTLEEFFSIIAAAPDADTANEKIAEALKLFASPDVPVLIVIYHVGDIIDYDAPTTAERYLNYIKDQKEVAVGISNVKYDSNNKITELELIKK